MILAHVFEWFTAAIVVVEVEINPSTSSSSSFLHIIHHHKTNKKKNN